MERKIAVKEAYIQKIKMEDYFLEVYIDPFNKRVRVEDYRGNVEVMIKKVEELVNRHKAEKCIILARGEHFRIFLEKAFQVEAMVDHFFKGDPAFYFTKYYTQERKENPLWLTEDRIIQKITELEGSTIKQRFPSTYKLKKLNKTDCEPLAILYQNVFQIYPTPLQNPDYIEKTMEQGTIYFGFTHNEEIVSAASAEVNTTYYNAELTDCATLPEHRKYGLMKHLLEMLEGELKKKSIYCVYSIARAQSYGMNAALYQLGYMYRGRLMNNCYIFDKLENMNMWVKDLSYLK